MKPRHLAAFLLPLLLAGCARQTQPEPMSDPASEPAPVPPAEKLIVYIPCGMIAAFRQVQREFEAATEIDVDPLFDNAVVLLRKIRAGEPCDVVVSPGRLEMEQLEQEQKVAPETVVTFGTFKMIVVVPAANQAGIERWQDLTKPEVRSVAVADPTQNSVGWYATEALRNLGLLDQLKPKIRHNWHAKTAVDWVCNDRVDAGLYFDACPFESGPEKIDGDSSTYRVVDELPADSYPPVQVQAGVVSGAPNPTGAQAFCEFLMSAAGQALLAANGVPNPPAAPSDAEESSP